MLSLRELSRSPVSESSLPFGELELRVVSLTTGVLRCRVPEVKKVQPRVKSAKTEEAAMVEAAMANAAKVMHLSYSCCSPLVVETNAALKSKERTQAGNPLP